MTSDNIAGYDEEKKARLSDALDLFRSARVVSFSRRADVVTICYEAKGREYTIRYDTEKGVLV